MVAPWIIWRYILRDLSIHSVLALAAITLLLLVGNTLRLLEDLAEAGIGLDGLGALLLAILPSYFSYAIPTALVFGVLVTFGRMSSDGEVVALRASGISVRRLLVPVLALAALAALASTWLLANVEPRAGFRLKQVARELGKSARLLVPGDFSHVGERVLYTLARGPGDCPLRGVVLGDFSDAERPFYVTAACGSLREGAEEPGLHFDLNDGSIHFSEARSERYRRLRFERMEFSLDVSEFIARRGRVDYYTTAELIGIEARLRAGERTPVGQGDRALRELWLQLHERAALPVASLVLGIVAVPLGIRPVRAGRSAGALTALAVVAAYWMLTSLGLLVAESGWIPPFAGAWLPNLAVLLFGLHLVRRSMYADS